MSSSDSPRKPPKSSDRARLRVVSPATDQEMMPHTYSDNKVKHIICLAILPFNGAQSFDYYKDVLLQALRNIFEKYPYYWQIAYSHDGRYSTDIAKNIDAWKKYAKVYLVDVSDDNAIMHGELARLDERTSKEKKGKRSLLFALGREDTIRMIPIRDEIPLLNYPVGDSKNAIEDFISLKEQERHKSIEHAIEDVTEKLRKGFQRPEVKSFNAAKDYHYLSPLVLRNSDFYWASEIADACAEMCKTMEDFVTTDSKEIARRLSEDGIEVMPVIIVGYQQAVQKLLDGTKDYRNIR